MKTGLLVHGRDLNSHGWERIMWGEPPYLLGRLSTAALVAIQEKPDIIVFGTGFSRNGDETEAEYIWHYLYDRFLDLDEFAEIQELNVSLSSARERIASHLALEMNSMSTHQEVGLAGRIFEKAEMERVIAVTDPTHAARCLNEGIAFYGRPESTIAVRNFSIRTSDIGWAPASDVVVLEPPHRSDDKTGNMRIKVGKAILNPQTLAKVHNFLFSE